MIIKYLLPFFCCCFLPFTQTVLSQNLRIADSISVLLSMDNYKDMSLFKKAEEQYLMCLKIDSLNLTANYNLAILYHNLAAYYYNQTSKIYTPKNMLRIKKSTKWSKKASPYFKTVVRLDPKKKDFLDRYLIKLD